MRRRPVLAIVIVLLALAAGAVAGQYTRAASVLVLAAELEGWPRRLVRVHVQPVVERTFDIPTRDGLVHAREYRPAHRVHSTVLLIAGVHPDGIDEPRLMHFARSLATVGVRVVTPEMLRLFAFEITPEATSSIEDVTAWITTGDDSAVRRVGLVGISFSGGLAVVAAGRESIRDRVAFVLSVGGHGELLRTLDVHAGGILADDEAPVTTDAFGLAMVLASVAHRVLPAEQVEALRDWARTFLEAAHLPLDDPMRGRLFVRADRMMTELPEPAATLAERARAADSAALRPHVLHHVRELAIDPALSPERAPPPRAAVYLLHGTEDAVIPPAESLRLAEYLRPHTSVRVLLTPVLTHADVERDLAFRDAMALVRFFASVLRR